MPPMARTVVIVDDHAGFRAEAKALLTDEGYLIVGEAGDGASAVSVATATAPDVILLEVQLPDASGFDVARRLSQAAPSSMVVLISSREAVDYGTAIAASGTAGFIHKANLSSASLSGVIERQR